MEVGILRAARDQVKSKPHWYAGCPAAQDDRLDIAAK